MLTAAVSLAFNDGSLKLRKGFYKKENIWNAFTSWSPSLPGRENQAKGGGKKKGNGFTTARRNGPVSRPGAGSERWNQRRSSFNPHRRDRTLEGAARNAENRVLSVLNNSLLYSRGPKILEEGAARWGWGGELDRGGRRARQEVPAALGATAAGGIQREFDSSATFVPSSESQICKPSSQCF